MILKWRSKARSVARYQLNMMAYVEQYLFRRKSFRTYELAAPVGEDEDIASGEEPKYVFPRRPSGLADFIQRMKRAAVRAIAMRITMERTMAK